VLLHRDAVLAGRHPPTSTHSLRISAPNAPVRSSGRARTDGGTTTRVAQPDRVFART
jgi:hypothetical protein